MCRSRSPRPDSRALTPHNSRPLLLLACLLALPAITPRAAADAMLTVIQDGGNVMATESGSIDLAGLTLNATIVGAKPAITPSNAALMVGPTGGFAAGVYTGITGPSSWGSGSPMLATFGAGDGACINGAASPLGEPFLCVPSTYSSGSPLLGTAMFMGQTLSSLGLNPGTYNYTWGTGLTADSLTVTVAAVPEPASIWFAVIGGAAIIAYGRFASSKKQRREAPVPPHGAAE
jgi:hypothetical protein